MAHFAKNHPKVCDKKLGVQLTPVLWIRIRSDPHLILGKGFSQCFYMGTGTGTPTKNLKALKLKLKLKLGRYLPIFDGTLLIYIGTYHRYEVKEKSGM